MVAQRRDADGRDDDLAAEGPAGSHEVADLGGVQRHGEIGKDRRPVDGAGAGPHSAGDVDADHRARGLVDQLDGRGGGALGRPREPGAEDRVDDHVGHLDDHDGVLGWGTLGVERLAGSDAELAEDVQIELRVAGVLAGGGQGEHRDLDAGVEELARHHEAVAAVVALAGEHDGLVGLVALEDLVGDRQPGALHQMTAGNADALDGGDVDLPHHVCGVQAEQQRLIHRRPP